LFLGFEQGVQLRPGMVDTRAVSGGPTFGNVFQPEMVVEVSVQQGPVHIQEDGVDGVPINNHERNGRVIFLS
jgi:hypothetical protein